MSTTNGNPVQTTDAGIPVESDQYSLTVGAGGPILLQDSYLIEQMANFNRERITERQPHAKGSGTFGRFEVTNDVSAFTKAALFQPGTTTRLVARFSTVAGERGSPDMAGPARLALKFYTTEGNYDMVGNDTPVFFVKDPMHFQNFIRSAKAAGQEQPAQQRYAVGLLDAVAADGTPGPSTATLSTTTPRSSRSPSSPTTWCRGSARARTGCFGPAVLLRRRSPGPARRELRTDPSQRPRQNPSN